MDAATQPRARCQGAGASGPGTRLRIRVVGTSYCSDRATSSLGAPVPDVQFLAHTAAGRRLLAKSWMIAE